jgi:hypothetical protein
VVRSPVLTKPVEKERKNVMAAILFLVRCAFWFAAAVLPFQLKENEF